MGLRNALTSLSVRARSLRTGASTPVGSQPGAVGSLEWAGVAATKRATPGGRKVNDVPVRQGGRSQHIGGSGVWARRRGGEEEAASKALVWYGALVRSRSALDLRQVYGPIKDNVVPPPAPQNDANLFNSRLASFIQAQQQAQSKRSTVLARRIEVGLQELADLVQVSRKGWKVGYEGRKPFLIDVREPHELEMAPPVPGAINVPLSVLKASLAMSSEDFRDTFLMEKPSLKNPDVVFYGRGPNNSMTALEIAHKSGYKVSRHFPGGISAWEAYMNNFGLDII